VPPWRRGFISRGSWFHPFGKQAVHLLVNPNTVQRAYEHLERERVLVSRRGSGMAVADGAPALAAARSLAGVRGAFAQGIEAGKAARLSRATIDGVYRKAWNGHTQSEEKL